MRSGPAAELFDSIEQDHINDVVRTLSNKFGVGVNDLVDEALVRDVVSEAMERLIRRNPLVRDGLFALWYTTAKNILRDDVRRQRRYPMVRYDAPTSDTSVRATEADPASTRVRAVEREVEHALALTDQPGPLTDLYRSDLRHALLAWMSRLSTRARMVLIRHDIEGATYEEIASELAVTVPAVKMQMHRTREQMREWITFERPDFAPSAELAAG